MIIVSSFWIFQHIPYQFAKRFFSETHKEVVLQVMGGRSCSVSYWLGKTRASFQYGWRAFLQENHLVLGDVCVFELIKDKKNSMRVFLFREGNNSSKEKSHAVSCSSCYRRKFTGKNQFSFIYFSFFLFYFLFIFFVQIKLIKTIPSQKEAYLRTLGRSYHLPVFFKELKLSSLKIHSLWLNCNLLTLLGPKW